MRFCSCLQGELRFYLNHRNQLISTSYRYVFVIIWTSPGLSSIGFLGKGFDYTWSKIQIFHQWNGLDVLGEKTKLKQIKVKQNCEYISWYIVFVVWWIISCCKQFWQHYLIYTVPGLDRSWSRQLYERANNCTMIYRSGANCNTQTKLCDLWPLLLTWFNFNPSMDK